MASRTLVRTISTKLAARKPTRPPITAEEIPPRSAPATEAEARLNSPIAPARPPQVPPMQTDTGTSRRGHPFQPLVGGVSEAGADRVAGHVHGHAGGYHHHRQPAGHPEPANRRAGHP